VNVDCCDVVTQLPPALLGCAHLGEPYYIDRNGSVIENPGDDFVSADRLRARRLFTAMRVEERQRRRPRARRPRAHQLCHRDCGGPAIGAFAGSS